MAAIVRRVLAEVCTVAVLLVPNEMSDALVFLSIILFSPLIPVRRKSFPSDKSYQSDICRFRAMALLPLQTVVNCTASCSSIILICCFITKIYLKCSSCRQFLYFWHCALLCKILFFFVRRYMPNFLKLKIVVIRNVGLCRK